MITPEISDVSLTVNGQSFSIARNQDTTAKLTGNLTRTSRACPPDCILPMSFGSGVATIGELEVIDFLQKHTAAGDGLVIDTRPTAAFAAGSIPGAVNVPAETLDASNRYQIDILKALGATQAATGLAFDNARDLVLFASANWDSQVTDAVAHLLGAGYPGERLSVYRGGIQDWQHLGLTVVSQ